MKEVQLSLLLNMNNPQSVFDEVKATVGMMCSTFEFATLTQVFHDIVRLFSGQYPGYRECTTEYHDLKHTTDTFLAMARLLHGVAVTGAPLTVPQVNLGLVCALMHDTGYIQTLDDSVGTGAKYTRVDTSRSITFMDTYLAHNKLSGAQFTHFPEILMCTGLNTTLHEISFPSPQVALLGKMLGTADLLGQMADRTYLEKLLFLYYEFREGGVLGYETELDLLKKTMGFYAMTKERFAHDLGGVNAYMRHHFRARWDLDRDLYMEAIEHHISYLRFILENHEKNYRAYLKRGGIVRRLTKRRAPTPC